MKKLTEKQQHWLNRINECEASGRKPSEYCRQQDLKLVDFYRWRNRLKARKLLTASDASPAGHFIPIELPAPQDETLQLTVGEISIHFPAKIKPLALKRLLSALGVEI